MWSLRQGAARVSPQGNSLALLTASLRRAFGRTAVVLPASIGSDERSKMTDPLCKLCKCVLVNSHLGRLQSSAVWAEGELRTARFLAEWRVSKFAFQPSLVLSPCFRAALYPWLRFVPTTRSGLLPFATSKWKQSNARRPSRHVPEPVDGTYHVASDQARDIRRHHTQLRDAHRRVPQQPCRCGRRLS